MSGNHVFEGGVTGIVRQRINNAAAAGDTAVVAAAAGKTCRVFGLRISVAGATVVQIKSSGGTVLEVLNFAAATPPVVYPLRGSPYHLSVQGEGITINSSAAVQVDGVLEYSNAGA